MSFPYPPKPWSDGDQVQQLQSDGTVITATYNLADNVWKMVRTNPDSDLAYVTDKQVFITNDGGGVAPVAKLLDPLDDVDSETTLYDRNKKDNLLSSKIIRQVYRINDNVDFINNSVSAGLWVHTFADQPAALPDPTEFFLFDENNQNTDQFNEVRKVVFAGEGVGTLNANADLQYTRVGDNLLIQENDENHFGYYVVDEVEIIGQPGMGGLWYIQMLVRVASNRAFGDVVNFAHCSVKVVRPVFVRNTPTPPILSENGQLWYNPTTNVLNVWDNDEGKFYEVGGNSDGAYLPLTGGTLTGNLNVGAQLKVTGANEFKVENSDGTNFLRVRPDNGTIIAKGQMSVNDLFDVKGDVVEYQKNRTSISQMGPNEIINAGILDNLMRAPNDGYLKDYLPLTGGELTGQLTIKKNNTVALDIIGDNNESQIKFWSSGAVALQNYTNFKDNELVTKKYVDDAVAAGGGNVDLDGYVSKTGQNQQITGNFRFFVPDSNEVLRVNQGSTVASTLKYTLTADGAVEQKGKHTYKFPLAGGVVVDVQSNSVSTAKIWADGGITTTKTNFNDDHLVTKAYVDGSAGQLQAAVSVLDGRVNEVLNLNLDEFVSNDELAQKQYVDLIELENRLDLLPQMPVNVATIQDIENAISNIPVSDVTQHDIDLAAIAVDAKFDMLRSAITEATDFDTLKARLLAVLN